MNEDISIDVDEEFVDGYSHIDEDVFYTTHNIPGPGIDAEVFYSQISCKCSCRNDEPTERKPEKRNLCHDKATSLLESTEVTVFGQVPIKNQQPHGEINQEKEICAKNCSCNPNPNYIDGKLDVDNHQLPIYECNDLCWCRNSHVKICSGETNRTAPYRQHFRCSNRVIQKGPNKHLEIFRHSKNSASKGCGVKAARNIRRGEFICEYVGEVIDKVEAKRRYKYYKDEHLQRQQRKEQQHLVPRSDNCNFYIFHLNEIVGDEKVSKSLKPNEEQENVQAVNKELFKEDPVVSNSQVDVLPSSNTNSPIVSDTPGPTINCTDSKNPNRLNAFEMFIDATKFGNIARYMNHSCDSNCLVLPVRVSSIYPRLAIFAKQDVVQGEELAYDYSGLDDDLLEVDIVNLSKNTDNNVKEELDNDIRGRSMKAVESASEIGRRQVVDKSEISSSETLTDKNDADLKPCFCGSDKCRKFLPYLPLQ